MQHANNTYHLGLDLSEFAKALPAFEALLLLSGTLQPVWSLMLSTGAMVCETKEGLKKPSGLSFFLISFEGGLLSRWLFQVL